jgi:hypothetical protein
MGTHRKSDSAARKAKYQRQTARTEANKKRNITKMKEANPNWPERKNNGMQ